MRHEDPRIVMEKLSIQETSEAEITKIWNKATLFGPNRISWILSGFLNHPNVSTRILTEVWYFLKNANHAGDNNIYRTTGHQYVKLMLKNDNLALNILVTELYERLGERVFTTDAKHAVTAYLKNYYPDLEPETTPNEWLLNLLKPVLLKPNNVPVWVEKKMVNCWGVMPHDPFRQ